ncbi:tetratricopeptide repeat protein [bacterium]|nr:tetratricopeptide repeat protein [bacterium]
MGLILLGLGVGAGLAEADSGLAPVEAMDAIFKKIPAQWWQGGWDHRKEVDELVSKYQTRTDLQCLRILYFGDYYYSNNQYDSAMDHYQKLIREYPDENATPTALRHLADLYSYRMNRYGDAMRLYTQVIEKYPASADAPAAQYRLGQIRLDVRYEQARGYLEKGYDESGLELYYRLIEEYGRDTSTEWPVVARMDLAEYYQSHNNLLQARKELGHVLEDYPRSSYIPRVKKLLDSREYILDSKARPNRLEYLFRKYRKAPRRFDGASCLPKDFQDGLRESKTVDDAIQCVKKNARIDTVGLARNFLQGLLEFEFGNDGEGLFLMREVSRASGENAALSHMMACMAYDLGGWAEGPERRLLYIQKISPSHVAQYWTGRVYADAGLFSDARRAFEPLVSNSPGLSDVSFYYAVSLHETGDTAKALKRLKTVSDTLVSGKLGESKRGKFQDAYCHIGGSFEIRGDSVSAVRYYQGGRCHAELASLHYQNGNFFEAAIQLEQARWNYDWMAHRRQRLWLAECYERLGAPHNAFEVMSHAVKICGRESNQDLCPDIRARHDELTGIISSRSNDLEREFPKVSDRLRSPRLRLFKEKKLPARVSLPKTAKILEKTAPELKSLKDHKIVFSARDQNRILAVSVSGALDPRGAVSYGGYWAHLSADGGERWTEPLYMGFAEGFPYVIGRDHRRPKRRPVPREESDGLDEAPVSADPILRISPFKDENIQIEVRIQEVDESTITFPQHRLQYKRVADGIYLVFPIEALTRDSDKDGLTDLYEEKIASDPYSDDTDRDGISDSIDLQPLTPFVTKSADGDFFRAAFGHIHNPRGRRPPADSPDTEGYIGRQPDIQDVIFVESARSLPVESDYPTRMIVIPPSAAGLYRNKFGTTFMLNLREAIFNRDRTEAFLKYDYSWRGGSLRAKKVNGIWRVEGIKRWIT